MLVGSVGFFKAHKHVSYGGLKFLWISRVCKAGSY